jgi:integrase
MRALPTAPTAAAAAVAKTVARSVMPATFEATARSFALFEDFCEDRDLGATLPATPMSVAVYLQHLLDTRQNFGAVSSAWRAVQFVHGACGLPSVECGRCKLLMRTARREFVSDVRRVTPLTPAMVKQIFRAFLHDDASEEAAALGIAIVVGYAGGARFSDLRGCTYANVTIDREGLTARPARRKNGRTRNGAPRPAALKEFTVARAKSGDCGVERYEFFAARFGWSGNAGTLCPWNYGSFLGRYRVALTVACGLSPEAAAAFGTHSGRRGAAHEARANGADPRSMRSFGGVTSELWEQWYADGLVPEERMAVSQQLVDAVAEA